MSINKVRKDADGYILAEDGDSPEIENYRIMFNTLTRKIREHDAAMAREHHAQIGVVLEGHKIWLSVRACVIGLVSAFSAAVSVVIVYGVCLLFPQISLATATLVSVGVCAMLFLGVFSVARGVVAELHAFQGAHPTEAFWLSVTRP